MKELVLLLTLAVAATSGCQVLASGKGGRDGAPPAIGVKQLRAEGLAHLEAGRYDAALRVFVEALSRQPEDVGLRYLLGVTFTHLERREDAIIAFRWVLARARPGTLEHDGAMRWLSNFGMLPPNPDTAFRSGESETVERSRVPVQLDRA